ncbi:hypothetical protein GOBAR_AA19552 [Gossypium barbadense]|uniref:Uncharacterized protein n=1 Tax=Gossypium barbadense TaxID=3634 RepID=A0A2P5XCP4_GOSBA|nr:hypothetical protein GOBAR_AA19552 [Gossypium barbadense]
MSNPRGKKIDVPYSKKRKGAASSPGPTIKSALEQIQLADAIRALLTTNPCGLFFKIIEPTYLKLTLEIWSTFHLQVVMTQFDDPGTVQFCLGDLVRQLSVPEFGVALGLYTEEFMDAIYDPSCFKASALAPSLRYLHAILAHTLTRQRKSTGIVNTHDAYFLWSMANGHVFDLIYFIALAIHQQMERHRKGVISIGPYGISSMLHMRMIERRHGVDPPQYRLVQSAEEEDPEDITDDVPSQHEDPPSQSPPIHRPVHICQYLHISSSLPPREPSDDDDV